IIVSEENGIISLAKEGRLQLNVSDEEIRSALATSLLSA
ncbi:MAG TPA: TIGR00159 family protein, partial [Bacteroidetes bacterium]|nr:TIGR00159 family protein [Bacteroidota bacterium]